MKHQGRQRRQSGVALVTTVIVVAVLAVVGVAFMQSTSIDRLSSRTVADYYRAQLAAEAGLAEAMSLIQIAAGTNRAFIVTETNHADDRSPVLLVGSNEATIVTNMFPMVSGPSAEYLTNRGNADSLRVYLDKRLSTNPLDTVDLNMGSLSVIQVTNSTDWYRVPWTYVTNATSSGGAAGANMFRYAFLVLDEQARLNPLLHRGIEATSRTNFGRTSEEVRVDTEGAPIVAGAGAIQSILQASNTIFTPQSLAFLSGTGFEPIKHLLSVHGAIDEDIIPSGYLETTATGTNFVPYADGGKPKYNLNDLATNTTHGASPEERAVRIAAIISSNLPSFFLRDAGSVRVGLSNNVYPTRLAASIVDYIDEDNIPTLGLDGEPAGKELAPYVVMVAEKNTWVSETEDDGSYSIDIRSEFFVQFWNPYTQALTVQDVRLEVRDRQTVLLPNGGVDTTFNDFVSQAETVTLRPNEMKSFAFGQQDQTFIHPTQPPSTSQETYPRWATTSSASSDLNGHPLMKVTIDETTLDMTRQGPEMLAPKAGLVRITPVVPGTTLSTFGPVDVIRWSFNFSPPNSPQTTGDPRANYLSSSDWAGLNNIASARWQGRQTDTDGRRQNFSELWQRRDYVRADGFLGQVLSSPSANPTTIQSTYSQEVELAAPAFIRNAAMLSIGELGHIFDPAQASDTGVATAGGAPSNFLRAGGGRSLRIGQPESPYWNVGGQRASQLLDLFTVNPMGTNTAELGSSAYTNTPVMRGRINVNTAPKPVLAGLFEGLTLAADQGISAAAVDSAKIADAVISNRPYSRISDLYKASEAFANGTNYIPAVTNVSVTISNAVSGGSTNYVAMAAMDRAREELFARSVNLMGTQSRAFRIFVVGEAIDATSNAVSRVGLEASLELKPLDDQSGFVQEIMMRKFQ